MLAGLINTITKYPMLDIVFREVAGNNLPHMAIVRNKDEFIDQSICQVGNTAAYFGTGLLLDKALDHWPKAMGLPTNAAAEPWRVFGKSLGIFSLIASIMLAMPFLRNYVTSRRTKTTNYAEMIGEKKRHTTDQKELKTVLHDPLW